MSTAASPLPRTLSLEAALPVAFGTMNGLAAIVLGMGAFQAGVSPAPAAVALVVTLGSVWTTDQRGWLRLNQPLSYLAAIAALAFTAYDVRRLPDESKVLALANLLLYLQCVQSLRRKDESIYWSLTSLALIEVAVAAALNDGMVFGVLLIVWFFAALVAQSLFLLWREARPPEKEAPAGSRWRRWFGRRSPGDGLPALRTASPVDPLTAGGLRRLLGYAAIVMLATLGLSGFLFLVVPRFGDGRGWGQTRVITQHTVGFSERVDLTDPAATTEDSIEVMRVQFLDPATNREMALASVPLFRGAVLTRYHDRAWRPPYSDNMETAPLDYAARDQDRFMIQEVEVQPLDTDALFAAFPVYRTQQNPDLLYDPFRERLARPQRLRQQTMKYRVLTAAAENGQLLRILPRMENVYEDQWGGLTKEQRQAMPGLVALAAETVANLPPEDIAGRAQALERRLRDSGDFTYSLSPPTATAGGDPMEHFIVRSRQGHCEYFASALVLMLRSQGIVSRMAVGYKGGIYNKLGGFYLVQQLHAHAWVEVYLPREYLPADAPQIVRGQRGGWLTLDPTPGADEIEAAKMADGWPTPQEVYEYVRYLWSNYVVGLDSQRQRAKIYQPILDGLRGLFDREAWGRFWQELGLVLSGRKAPPLESWFHWRAGLLFIACATPAIVLLRRRRRRQARASEDALRERKRRADPPVVDFYRRWEALLSERAWVRSPTHTQREFAALVAADLGDAPATRHLAGLPRQVVDAFYRLRFGGGPLDGREAQQVEQALDALKSALAQRQT